MIDDHGGVVEGESEVGQARVAPGPARQAFEARGQVVADEADHPPLERRRVGIRRLPRVRQPVAREQPREGSQDVAPARSPLARLVPDRPPRPRRLEDQARPGGQDAPASRRAEARPALQQGGLPPPADDGREPLGGHFQGDTNGAGHDDRHVSPRRTSKPEDGGASAPLRPMVWKPRPEAKRRPWRTGLRALESGTVPARHTPCSSVLQRKTRHDPLSPGAPARPLASDQGSDPRRRPAGRQGDRRRCGGRPRPRPAHGDGSPRAEARPPLGGAEPDRAAPADAKAVRLDGPARRSPQPGREGVRPGL